MYAKYKFYNLHTCEAFARMRSIYHLHEACLINTNLFCVYAHAKHKAHWKMRSISTHAKNIIFIYLFISTWKWIIIIIIIDNSVFNIYYYSLRRGWFRNLCVFLLQEGKSYITFWKPERNDGKVYSKYLILSSFWLYSMPVVATETEVNYLLGTDNQCD